jgi:hypothetical protein
VATLISSADSSLESPVDFNLHDLVGIRLLGARSGDAAAVARQLGMVEGPLGGQPDVTIRFVDQLPTSTSVRLLGVNDAGFTDDAFLVLRGKHKASTRVRIPFERIGRPCEIVCQRGVPAVPLLIPIVNLAMLGKGALALHASAFNYNGTGVLATGWAKGGKTETLLSFMAHGAEYVGDEWVYLSRDGRRMYGIPEPMRLWDWQLRQLPQYWRCVERGDRGRLIALRLLVKLLDWGVPEAGSRQRFSIKGCHRIAELVKRQQYVQLSPHKLFAARTGSLSGVLEKVFFVSSCQSREITVRPTDPREIARRMVFSLREERGDFLSYYHKFRFAFPDCGNELIEQAEALERELLTRALADRLAYCVEHPYPVSIPALFDAIRPYL